MSKKEIEQLAFLKYPRVINDPYKEDDNDYERQIWIDSYTQCQEDARQELENRMNINRILKGY